MSTAARKSSTNPLTGNWRLVSWEVKKADGSVYLPFGQDLDGYIGYADHGSMSVFMRLQRKFVFYAGTYDVKGDTVTHHVTVASSPSNEGRDLVRLVCIEGDRLTLTTVEPPPRSMVEGAEAGDTSRLIWERVH